MRWLGFIVLLSSVSFAKDKPTYPEHGTVVAMRSDTRTRGTSPYTDPYGKIQGGGVHSYRIPVFKIRTDDLDYEIEGRNNLSIDEAISFRIEKRVRQAYVYIQRGDKEDRYLVVAEEKR